MSEQIKSPRNLSPEEAAELKRQWEARYVGFEQEKVDQLESNLTAVRAERERYYHAAEVWQARYQELVQEPLPRLLYRRLIVAVVRMMGGKRTT